MNRRMSYQWAFIFVNTITYALIQVICIIGIETGWWFPPWAGGVIYVVILAISGWSGLMVAGAIRALEKLYDNY